MSPATVIVSSLGANRYSRQWTWPPGDSGQQMSLKLADSRAFSTGIVNLVYTPART